MWIEAYCIYSDPTHLFPVTPDLGIDIGEQFATNFS